MPKKEDFTFLSNDGKTQIHAVRWMPDAGKCKAVLQITHGMIEYIERYDAFASYLASQGYLVVGHDHLGHGASVDTVHRWTRRKTGDILRSIRVIRSFQISICYGR